MSDGTPQFPEDSHSPFSDKLPKDATLQIKFTDKNFRDKIAQSGESTLENIPRYPELHTLSLFANLAYKKGDEIQSALVKVKGWQLLATAESKNGYFGAAFWHPANHQIVIAHRGTKPLKIWDDVLQADIRGVYLNNYVGRMSSAATFAEEMLTIFEKVEKELNYSIQLFFTGHSLGGWLAQVTTFTTEYLRPMKNADRYLFQNPPISGEMPKWNYHAHTVVFESPGCAGMLRKMRKSFDISSSNRSIDLNTLDITTYLSAPNIINTCNEHLGSCYRLITDLSKSNIDKNRDKRPLDYIKTLAKCIVNLTRIPHVIFEYTFKTHSKEKIQELLVGKPISELKGKIKEIIDWPTLDVPQRKDYNKIFEVDLLHWANNFHLDHVDKCVDENGLYGVRYQTKDFDELSGHLSIFAPTERMFLERYVWMRESELPVFQPAKWFSSLENEELENKAVKLLGDFSIGKKKFRCSTVEILKEFVPFVKRLLKLYPYIDKLTQDSITAEGIVKKIFQFEAQNYRKNFERKSNVLDVNVESFGILDFLAGEKRIYHALAPESKNKNLGIRLVYSAVKEILRQKAIITDDSQCTILKLKRFLNVMQQGINVQHIFQDAIHLLLLDCRKLELDDAEKRFLSGLFLLAKNTTSMKLILLSNNVPQDETVGDLIGKQKLDMFYDKTALISLNWTDLTLDYQLNLLKKTVCLAGSSEKLQLEGLFRDDPPPVLSSEAILELINARDVIIIGNEPQRLSDLEAAYAKCFVTIEASNLRRAMVRVDNVHTIFIIDGLLSLQALIDTLKVVDDDEVTHLESQMNKNIRLVTGEYSEQEFKQFCHEHPTSQIQWISYKSLSGEWIWKQMYDHKFYVEREINQIAHPETIKSILEDKNSTESFVVSGVEYGELLQLIGLNINDEEEKKRVSSRLFAIEKSEDLENFKSNRNDPVHRLKYEVRIGSNAKQLVRQVPDLENETLSVIVDHPGMGKSTTLTWLATKRLNKNWVMRLNLKDCSSHLKVRGEPNVDQVVDFLWKATDGKVEAYLAKSVLKYLLGNPKADVERPILLLFDGFDEVDLIQQGNVISLLRSLQGIFGKSKHRMVITTRRHPELEKELQMLYTVEFTPLDRKDQIKFLENLWLRRSKLLILDLAKAQEKSGVYADKLLKKAETTLRENTAQFIGIPMQLRLLTEGFRKDFLKFSNSSDNDPHFESFDLLGIYEFFIKAKYELLFKEKITFSELSRHIYERWVKEKFTLIQRHLARSIIFSESDQQFYSNDSPEDDEYGELYRLGLIQKIREQGRFEFIHFTFVEYYVADFLMPKLPELACVTPTNSAKKFLLCDILTKPKYGVVRSFLDNMLRARGKPIKEVQTDDEAKESHSIYEREIFLHVAAAEGNCELIKFLFRMLDTATLKTLLSFQLEKGDFKREAPLHIAAERGYSDIVGLLLAQIEENEKSAVENFAVNAKGNRGETPLHLASRNSRVEVVQILLKANHVDVDVKSDDGSTPLHYAAFKGHSDIVRLLLARIEENEESKVENFAVNAKGKRGKTPLHLASENGHVEVVRVLLKAKHVDVNAKSNCHLVAGSSDDFELLLDLMSNYVEEKGECEVDVNVKDEERVTPLHLAIAKGHYEIVRMLLKAKQIDVKAATRKKGTPLHVAAIVGNSDIVKLLLSQIEGNEEFEVENFAVNAKDKYGLTPLLYAFIKGSVEVVQILLTGKNHDVNMKSGQSDETALHFAIRCSLKNKTEIIQCLLSSEEIDVNVRNKDNMTPLHLASKSNQVEIVKTLLAARNIDVNAKGGKNDETALHSAIRSSHKNRTKIIKYLLSSEEINVNSINKDNMTPLHLASKSNQVEIVKTLLAARNIDVNAKDGKNDETALHSAIRSSHKNRTKIIKYLHSSEEIDVNSRNKDNVAPLHLAAKSNQVEIVKTLLAARNIDVNAKGGKNDETALHSAIRSSHKNRTKIIKYLLSSEEIDVNSRNKDNVAPLHLAAKSNQVEIVKTLLAARNIDVNAKGGKNDETALHSAIRSSHKNRTKIIKYLLSSEEIDVNSRNKDNMTPLHLASKSNQVEIVKTLLAARNIDVNAKGGKNDETALHSAIRSSHKNRTKIIKYLLSSEEIDVNSRNKDNMTPLHLASKSNQVEIVKTLLATRNIDVNAKGGKNDETVLHSAIRSSHKNRIKIIKYLLSTEEIDVNSRNKDNMTPMQMASDEGHTDVVKLLVEYHG